VSTLSLRLPQSLHKQLEEIAQREGVSIDQFVTMAVAEKVAAFMTIEYPEERAARSNRVQLDRVLAKVHDVPAEEDDQI
jgi:hypothetical protein